MSRTCCWCKNSLTINDRPKLLECFHSCCEACVKQEQNKIYQLGQSTNHITVVCPTCKMESRNDYIIENQFLIELLESAQNDENGSGSGTNDELSKCSNDCQSPATSYCVECEALICDDCVRNHQLLKITKDHTIKSKDAAETKSDKTMKKEIKCSTHPIELLNVYCETCDRLTCRDCQLLEHNSHKYKFVKDMAAETREQLQGLLSEINYKKVLLSSAMKVIDDRQALIAEKKTELSKDIHDLVAKLANAVSSRGKQLLFRLNQVCEHKLQVLSEKKDTLQQLNSHTDHCINFVQNVVDNGSDTAVLYSKKTLSKHLHTVKCQRADIPNPEIPVRIQLFLSNVPELENVISRIGTILVDGKVYPPNVQPAPGGSITPPSAQNPLQQLAQQIEPRSQQQQQQPQPPTTHQRQRQSPNVTTPPLRPLLPQGAPNTFNHSANLFGPNGSQFPAGMRNFPGGDSGRYQMPPHAAMGPPQSHVTSSTDPHSMRNGKNFIPKQISSKINDNFPI
jgi:tripartite motif-containing protein 33